MPATTILYPRGFFDGGRPDNKSAFRTLVMQAVAGGMDAVDPDPAKAGSRTRFAHNPPLFIDLVMLPYDPDDANVTTPFLGTIVTYGWPDRMRDLGERMERITQAVRQFFDARGLSIEGKEMISFTFIPKPDDGWFAA